MLVRSLVGGFTLPLPPRWKLPLTSHIVLDIFVRVRVCCVPCVAMVCALRVACPKRFENRIKFSKNWWDFQIVLGISFRCFSWSSLGTNHTTRNTQTITTHGTQHTRTRTKISNTIWDVRGSFHRGLPLTSGANPSCLPQGQHQGALASRDVTRRHETPREVETKRDDTLREAPDASRRLQDAFETWFSR